MFSRFITTMALISALALLTAVSGAAELPDYTVFRTDAGIVIDGVLNEDDWAKAEPAGEFVFPWWTSGAKEQTEAKMLWDDDHLYVAFRCDDAHMWADHYSTNDWTYNDDCAEIFWFPGPEATDSYYTFEINCLGNLLSVYVNPANPITHRDSRIMVPRIGRTVQGTVNNDNDTDTSWVLEVAIRFSDYPELSSGEPPSPGDVWRAGLNRCGGKTNPQYSQWSPSQTTRPNFHRPTEFGKLVFSALPAGSVVSVDGQDSAPVPVLTAIESISPNPFNAATSITFSLADAGAASVDIYSLTGQKVRALVSGRFPSGVSTVVWDGSGDNGAVLSSGVYIVQVRAGGRVVSAKTAMVK